MKIVVFGLSITSTWGNGHGTTYRALLQALHARGHRIVFFEKDVEWYASNRDLAEPDFCELHLYDEWNTIQHRARKQLRTADVAMVGSYFPDGVAAIDEMLDAARPLKAFYDIDTPVTVSALRAAGDTDYIAKRQIPALDIYFSFTGGPMLREIEEQFGASRAVPLYCSVDPNRYRRQAINPKFACDLSYMGTYAADRQAKIEQLLIKPARRLANGCFIVAGPQYPETLRWPQNLRRISHLGASWHAEFYSSSKFTLNVTRRDMTVAGYSPSVRLFEAAACGATIISDSWPGIDTLFVPGSEILLPTSTDDVMRYLTELDAAEVRGIGDAAQARVLSEHNSAKRAEQFERAIEDALAFPHAAPEDRPFAPSHPAAEASYD